MATETRIEVETRRHQMFPVLSAPDIARIRRFGSVRRYARGDACSRPASPGPGMFVLLEGRGGHHASATAWATWCRSCARARGISWPRSASCRGGPRWSTATPRTTSRRCCAAGPAARADHRRGRPGRAPGARADPAPRRADRVRRQRPGADRPAASRPTCCGCRTSWAATAIRTTWSMPTQDADAAALLEQYGAAPSDCWPSAPTAACCSTRPRTRWPAASAWSTASRTTTCSTCWWSAPARPGWPPRSTRPPKGLRVIVLDCRAFGGQAGASARIENYLGFPDRHLGPGAGRARLRAGAEVRRRDADPGAGRSRSTAARAETRGEVSVPLADGRRLRAAPW